VFGWFTEGLETAPLRAARAALDELGNCQASTNGARVAGAQSTTAFSDSS
jgi:hypothetical protein